MRQLHTRAAFARLDPAHLFDGLFVPTRGNAREKISGNQRRRQRLLIEPRNFGAVQIGYQGYEQLGADDQSVLLAVAAELGIDGQTIDADSSGPIAQQLRTAMDLRNAQGQPLDRGERLISRRTELRSLLVNAGYRDVESGNARANVRASLNRLRNAQIRERNNSGWDRVCNLISATYNEQTREVYVAANPRLATSIFGGQNIQVSLHERNEIRSEVGKLLHAWLCSHVRLGEHLGNGHGARLDTLAPHVWGPGHDQASRKVKSIRRGLLRAALAEIDDRTRRLHGGHGWAIDQTPSGVMVSRPKTLPRIGVHFPQPADYAAAVEAHWGKPKSPDQVVTLPGLSGNGPRTRW